MNPRVLFVILIVLVVLLAVGIGLGATQEDGQVSGAPASWVESLNQLLVKEQRLSSKDVKAAVPSKCRDQLGRGAFVLSQGDACTLIVGESSAPVRTLSVRLVKGDSARVTLDHRGEDRLTDRQTLEGSQREVEIRIFKEGGTLEIRCLSAGESGCRLEVEK